MGLISPGLKRALTEDYILKLGVIVCCGIAFYSGPLGTFFWISLSLLLVGALTFLSYLKHHFFYRIQENNAWYIEELALASPRIFSYLLKKTDKHGKTPFQYAITHQKWAVAKVLYEQEPEFSFERFYLANRYDQSDLCQKSLLISNKPLFMFRPSFLAKAKAHKKKTDPIALKCFAPKDSQTMKLVQGVNAYFKAAYGISFNDESLFFEGFALLKKKYSWALKGTLPKYLHLLNLATHYNRTKMVKALYALKNAPWKTFKYSRLHTFKAPCEVKSVYLLHPIFLAIKNNNLSLIQLFISAQTLTQLNEQGQTPLEYALSLNHYSLLKCIERLIKANALSPDCIQGVSKPYRKDPKIKALCKQFSVKKVKASPLILPAKSSTPTDSKPTKAPSQLPA